VYPGGEALKLLNDIFVLQEDRDIVSSPEVEDVSQQDQMICLSKSASDFIEKTHE
jgi:hypothetical protein